MSRVLCKGGGTLCALEMDLCNVSAIAERAMILWAVAGELPRVSWFEKDMGGMGGCIGCVVAWGYVEYDDRNSH